MTVTKEKGGIFMSHCCHMQTLPVKGTIAARKKHEDPLMMTITATVATASDAATTSVVGKKRNKGPKLQGISRQLSFKESTYLSPLSS